MMVMTYIDQFSKKVQLVQFQESGSQTIAGKFRSTIVSHHRLSNCTTSNHKPSFCAHFWDKLMSLLDITLTFSMASHPQIDRMAKVTNYTIE